MRSFFGGGNSSPAVTPDYTGLQIQTAVNALPVPIGWGLNKLAPNLIWYDNFIATPQTSGSGGKGGGGGGGSVTGYTYSADVIMALCEGPIEGIGQIWRGQSDYTLADLGLTLFTGTTPQSAWGYLTANYPEQALAYQGTAYVCAASYGLGDSATLDNHNFEVQFTFYATGTNGLDADPAPVINDFLTNVQYGAVSPTGAPINVDSSTLFGSGGDASLQTYCKGVGLCFSPTLTDQEKASETLTRWLQILNIGPVWSGGQLKFLPYGDTATVAGTHQTATQQRQIPNSEETDTTYATIIVTAAANFVSDGGVTYALTGTSLTNTGTAPTTAGTYGISPNGTYLFSFADGGALVEISYTYQVAASYSPNVTPIYDLDDDDYVVEPNDDPVQVSRTDPYEAYNIWRLEVCDRGNAYNLIPVESRSQNAIQRFGERIAPTFTAHEICDPFVGLISGQLMVQRAVNIRNTYKLRLSWEYCLLDPMDIVTLTDSILGLSKTPARINEIEENEDGLLDFTMEEFPLGVATATLYATQPAYNSPINRSYVPDQVNTPVIYEPPSAFSSTSLLLIGASGGSGGAADPLWGGAFVFLSLDKATFDPIGIINAPARQGVLTANLPLFSGTNPDTADTLKVNLGESGGVLQSASGVAAQLGATLCLVDGELLSYTTATLVSGNTYNLTGLYRGLYGTTAGLHTTGAQFLRIDAAVFEYDLPAQFVNHEIYIKLQSFNAFNTGVEDLSECVSYPYTPAGLTEHPIATALAAGTNENYGAWTGTVGTVDNFGSWTSSSVVISVNLGAWH